MKQMEKVALAKTLGIAGGIGAGTGALGYNLPVPEGVEEDFDNPELLQALMMGGLGVGGFLGGKGGLGLARKLLPRYSADANKVISDRKIPSLIANILGAGGGAYTGGGAGAMGGTLAAMMNDSKFQEGLDQVK